jgi:5-methylcytosine-specific restriction protein B
MANDEYHLTGPDADATGVFTDDGFLIKAGSFARREIVPSAKSVASLHRRLINDGAVEQRDTRYLFIKDFKFRTPSGAASAVLGRSANGWRVWKRVDGKSLSEVKRVSRNLSSLLLDEQKHKEIVERHRQLVNQGDLPTERQLDRQYELFRTKFGPSVLASLDGEALLTLMHDHTNRDSLVYWLEFKNDEDFKTLNFGSIAGGSALKFRLFRRKETGNWQAGVEKANQPKDITLEEAVELARSHRDQLLKGVGLLDALPKDADDDDYAELQDQMDEDAPDVSRLAWGHKYFSLLFPDKLDDYHSPDWQRFHLLKMLQLPPVGDGRYVGAGRFVAAAKEVGLHMNHFTATLNSLQGRRHAYWRIGTTSGTSGDSFWPMMQERGCIAIGWPKLGDIGWVDGKRESLTRLKTLVTDTYPAEPSSVGLASSQLSQFVAGISEGDVVVAAEGAAVLGIGRVTGEYEFHPECEFPHQRLVDWVNVSEWKLPDSAEGLRSTVRQLGKSNENLLAIEQHLTSSGVQQSGRQTAAAVAAKRPTRLTGVQGRIQSILERKGQAVLYGPPGTGKSYWAERTANELAALSAFGRPFEALNAIEKSAVTGDSERAGLVRTCCFHPAYGYEDFLEGYRPSTLNGSVNFELRDGVFKRLCRDAAASPAHNFYLVVDEINRGDIPRIFGELLMAIEKDKRGKQVLLPASQQPFSVPTNVFMLGTMNTADRSISLLDTALRRRFGFIELMPDSGVLKGSIVAGIPLKAWLDALNGRIREHVGRDARNLQIGHSYLMHGGSPLKEVAMLKRAIRDDIVPLLEEYCYEDYDTLGNILGDQLVDVASQRIRHDLFEEGQEDALVQGLLSPFSDISTSSDALASEEAAVGDTPEDEADEP